MDIPRQHRQAAHKRGGGNGALTSLALVVGSVAMAVAAVLQALLVIIGYSIWAVWLGRFLLAGTLATRAV